MDTFPYETWDEAFEAAVNDGAGYFTFGPGGNTSTYVLVALGFLTMLVILVYWTRFEDRLLNEHVRRLSPGGDN